MTSARRPRRVRNQADKQARIARAALELFTQRGFDETTTKAIAERAGVAAGTVFLYADDKRDLLVLAMREELARIVEDRLARLPDGPLLEQLLFLFGGFLAFYGAHPRLASVFVTTLLTSKGKNTEALDGLTLSAMGRIGTLVELRIARGEVASDVPPLLLAQNAFALYFAALSAWLRGYVATPDESLGLLRMSLELQLRGLAPR
jgi:AcrR family transcriptional regulator